MSDPFEWSVEMVFRPEETIRREGGKWFSVDRGEPIRQAWLKGSDPLPASERFGDGVYLFTIGRQYVVGPIVEAELREAGYGPRISKRDIPPSRYRHELTPTERSLQEAFERIEQLEAARNQGASA